MFEVIINTISSGKVQRKLFDTLTDAERCADNWDAKTSVKGKKTYRVEMHHRSLPAIQAVAGAVLAVQAAMTNAA